MLFSTVGDVFSSTAHFFDEEFDSSTLRMSIEVAPSASLGSSVDFGTTVAWGRTGSTGSMQIGLSSESSLWSARQSLLVNTEGNITGSLNFGAQDSCGEQHLTATTEVTVNTIAAPANDEMKFGVYFDRETTYAGTHYSRRATGETVIEAEFGARLFNGIFGVELCRPHSGETIDPSVGMAFQLPEGCIAAKVTATSDPCAELAVQNVSADFHGFAGLSLSSDANARVGFIKKASIRGNEVRLSGMLSTMGVGRCKICFPILNSNIELMATISRQHWKPSFSGAIVL